MILEGDKVTTSTKKTTTTTTTITNKSNSFSEGVPFVFLNKSRGVSRLAKGKMFYVETAISSSINDSYNGVECLKCVSPKPYPQPNIPT